MSIQAKVSERTSPTTSSILRTLRFSGRVPSILTASILSAAMVTRQDIIRPGMRRYFSPNRLRWLAIILLLGCAVWYGLFLLPSNMRRIKLAEVQTNEPGAQTSEPEKSIDEQAEGMRMNVNNAQITMSSGDGQMKMRMWAESGDKNGDVYGIDQGALQFALESRDTLILKVTDGKFTQKKESAQVEGTLIGYIVGSQQFFSASTLTWDPNGRLVTATRVTFSSPHMEVTGDRMTINLETGEVRFEGPVEAGI